MTTLLTVILVGVLWPVGLIVFIALAVAAARGDRLARRALGPASSDDLKRAVVISLDDRRGPPHERRHT